MAPEKNFWRVEQSCKKRGNFRGQISGTCIVGLSYPTNGGSWRFRFSGPSGNPVLQGLGMRVFTIPLLFRVGNPRGFELFFSYIHFQECASKTKKKKKTNKKKKKKPTTPHAFLMHHNWLLTCGLRTFRLVDLGLLTRILNLRRLYVLWNSCLPKSGPLNSGSPCLSPGSAPLA